MADRQLSRRAGLVTVLRLAFVAPAILAVVAPGEAAANSDSSKKKRRAPVVQAPRPGPRQPVNWLGPLNVPAPQGTERMVSEPVRLHGVRGDGAGPVRIDLDGAQPGSAYEVAFVPRYDPHAVLPLGKIQTDGRGAFHGVAPEHVPPLLEIQRAGTLVLRRLPVPLP